MNMPANALSSTPEPSAFLPPRTSVRFGALEGKLDVHMGPIAIGDTSHGITYQLWTAYTDGNNVWLQAPNTVPFILLPNVGAAWVALAFDQSGRIFIAYSTAAGVASYYWFDTTISNYRTSPLGSGIFRVFAVLDDNRVIQVAQSDVILAYVKPDVNLYFRQQRDRFGVEYLLGAAPSGAALVQIGMSHVNRLQFAFQNVQGNSILPPSEYQLNVGGVINAS